MLSLEGDWHNMHPFEYANPTSVKDAVAMLGSSWADANILAGGTDQARLAVALNSHDARHRDDSRAERGTERSGALDDPIEAHRKAAGRGVAHRAGDHELAYRRAVGRAAGFIRPGFLRKAVPLSYVIAGTP